MKSFTKKATAIAILATLTVPGIALSEAELFGKAHLSFGSISQDDGVTDTSSNAVSSHASRVGVKGNVDTDGSTKVIYRFVWQIDMADDAKSSDDHIKSREQYVGLKDSWGEVRIGRDDSPYKLAGKKNVEHLSDTYADFNNIIDKGQDTRNDNSISYRVQAGPGKLGIMYAGGDDSVTAENAFESTSIAYDIKMGNIGFALATQTIEKSATNDETGVKLSFGYKLSNTQIGLMYEAVEDDLVLDDTNTYISIKQGVGKSDSIVFAYGYKDQGNVDDATMTTLAYQHKMAKKVSVYALWADGADGGLADATKLAGDGSAIAIGVIAKF